MESTPVKPVSPADPIAPYLGGKRLLAKKLIRRIRPIPHTTYAEPFVGMGGVFLRRPFQPRAEVINDINREIANLFRILQRHLPQFLDTLKFQITSRAEFQRQLRIDPDTLTDLECAARFLFLQRTAFGGKPTGQSFGVSPARPSSFNLTNLEPLLEEVHSRLAGVVIECLPYADFISQYDRPETLFYLDPPYWGGENDYGKGVFSRRDFEKLAGILKAIDGHFLLSINDRPEIRDLFAWAHLEAVELNYTIGNKNTKRAAELIISGNDKYLSPSDRDQPLLL